LNIINFKLKIYKTENTKERRKGNKMNNSEAYKIFSEISLGTALDCGMTYMHFPENELFKPEKIIYNGRATVCIFPDGEKIVVKATEDEKYSKEHGVAMCIIRKIFDSRLEFLRLVEGGYEQVENKKESKKKGK
jgi:hypothetical protein